MTTPAGLKMGDRVENRRLRGDAVGTVERLAWAMDGKLHYVFVNWGGDLGRKWEIPNLLRHVKETV